MEKQYFESFDNKTIPYLFFESKREKYKNSVDKIRILLYNTDINKERTAQSII